MPDKTPPNHATPRESRCTASPIRIGCAGWGLSTKVAARFPAHGSHLERYAQIFSAVEINSSFYRSHQPKTYARWAASVPDAFRFSVKVPRRISHELRLRDADAAVKEFVREVTPLGEKLGCLLLQLPPRLALDTVPARDFFSLLRGLTAAPIVCEPRHTTWFTEEGAQTLKNAGIACVRAHPSPIAGVEPVGDPGTLYIRLHGSPETYYSAYDEPFIEAVAARILDARNSNSEVWCIFDNTARGEAVPNALTLMEKLEKTPC
ncbi:DUF72 domain-containing protein [Paraburkholderia sp. Cpub6]|uniref:DUF72 domain-containing protein n=1 Tax=Paraburkholderia sp. Cpub6 TaxID=2723094 RepID=UPI001617CFE0|nr:DUF72 domain-containing protein [Paraburkholderia sp. Cpub6]MBB5460326.1 uncharacterized protein YecE (DUF72 family) [Paraburkholderia sp. Cpub6]